MAATVASADITHEQVMAAIETAKLQLSPETQQKAEEAMAKVLALPETSQKLLQEVKDLGDAALKVDQTFIKVSGELALVDQNDYKDKNDKPIPKLKPTWDGFHRTYINILWKSKDAAVDTAAYISDFYEVFLPEIEDAISEIEKGSSPDKAAKIETIHTNLEDFLKQENPATAKSNRPSPPGADPLSVAQAQSQDFLDLKKEIDAFHKTFETFAEGTSADLQQRLATVSTKIENLKFEIKSYANVIKGLAIAMGATGLATGAGALGAVFALGPLGPAVAIGILIAGAVAMATELGFLISYMSRKSAAEEELRKCTEEKKNIEKQLETLKALKAKLESQTEDINYITGRLDQFANIWSLVASDARECNDKLKRAVETKSYDFLKRRIELLKRSYASLYVGLKEYSTKVSESGATKPSEK